MAEGKGVYTIFQSDIDLLTLLFGFTFSSTLVYFVSSQKIALEKLIGVGVLIILIGCFVLSFLLFLLNASFSNNFLFPIHYSSLFHYCYLIISSIFVLIASLISSIFQGKSLFKIVNLNTIFISAINFIILGSVFAIQALKISTFTVNHILLISLTTYLINIFFWIVLFKKHIRINPVFKFDYKQDIKPIISFTALVYFSNIINFLTYKIDYWFVGFYSGVKELGIYSQAVGLSQMFLAFTTPILIVLTPYLSSKDSEKSLNTFKFYSRINFTVLVTLIIFAVSIAGYIFPIYGKEFTESVLPFRILSFAIIMSSITKVFGVYLHSKQLVKYNLIATIIGFSTTLFLDIILIPKYGAVGASIASVISYSALAISVLYFLLKKTEIKFNNMFLITLEDINMLKSKILILFFKKQHENSK